MKDKDRILVVDDDPSVRRLLALRLNAAGYETKPAANGEQALGLIVGFRPRLVITDLRMPGIDGMGLFETIRKRHTNLPVIILTAHGSIPDAVTATHNGVFSYLTKPFDSDELLKWVAKALQLGGETGASRRRWRDAIITRNADMEATLREAAVVAQGDVPILIQGAAGTGKTLLARALHRAGEQHGRLVEANAALIPSALLATEFFGRDSAASAGDGHSGRGLFQRAEGGALLIDNIDSLPPNFQIVLFQALRDQCIRLAGSRQKLPINARLIASMRNDEPNAREQQRLRGDICHALGVVPLYLPSLGSRRDDIPLLAMHFLTESAKRSGKRVNGFSPQAMERLIAAPWPGNVSQLRSVVERAVALADIPLLAEDLVSRALSDQTGEELTSLSTARDEFEHDYLVQLMRIAEGNVSHAARLAQRNRTEFYKLLHRHHLDPKSFRDTVN
jgi:two-component system response regulator GlrR